MKTFRGGVHVPDNKYLTRDLAIEEMPIVPEYYLALSQHIGAPATPVVAEGDKVEAGQVIALGEGFSASVHSPVSGEVVGIVDYPTVRGVSAKHIHIKSSDTQTAVKLSPLGEDATAEQIVTRVAEAGIIGLGGAGFPTAIKLKPTEPVDTLVINGAECEPYLNSDNRLMLERTEGVIAGIRLIAKALGVAKVVVGIEANKPAAISAMSGHEGIEVITLKKKYPQGGEKQLIDACIGKKVPVGKLPMHVGVVVNNIATAYAVYDAAVNGNALYSKVITVTGRGIVTPKMLEVRVGTPWQDIVEYCGGITEDTSKVICGGPMMGVAMQEISGVVNKADSDILVLTEAECSHEAPSNCIKCGKCVDHCPMKLMPNAIDFNTQVGDTTAAIGAGALNCIECGVCAFVCPAKRPIVQAVRLTKMRAKEMKK